jgi:hypothetical protein
VDRNYRPWRTAYDISGRSIDSVRESSLAIQQEVSTILIVVICVGMYQYFGGIYGLHLQDIRERNLESGWRRRRRRKGVRNESRTIGVSNPFTNFLRVDIPLAVIFLCFPQYI